MTKQFIVGSSYSTRSICDYDTIFRFKIVSRTAKQVTFEQHGEVKRRGIYIYDGVEQFKPYGTYSMCPIVSAEYSSTPEDVKLIGRSGDRTGINDGPLLAVSSETAYGRTVAYPFSIKVF